MEKWEYKKEPWNCNIDEQFIEFLNSQGEKGWEYIERDYLNLGTYICIFKRKIQNE